MKRKWVFLLLGFFLLFFSILIRVFLLIDFGLVMEFVKSSSRREPFSLRSNETLTEFRRRVKVYSPTSSIEANIERIFHAYQTQSPIEIGTKSTELLREIEQTDDQQRKIDLCNTVLSDQWAFQFDHERSSSIGVQINVENGSLPEALRFLISGFTAPRTPSVFFFCYSFGDLLFSTNSFLNAFNDENALKKVLECLLLGRDLSQFNCDSNVRSYIQSNLFFFDFLIFRCHEKLRNISAKESVRTYLIENVNKALLANFIVQIFYPTLALSEDKSFLANEILDYFKGGGAGAFLPKPFPRGLIQNSSKLVAFLSFLISGRLPELFIPVP